MWVTKAKWEKMQARLDNVEEKLTYIENELMVLHEINVDFKRELEGLKWRLSELEPELVEIVFEQEQIH